MRIENPYLARKQEIIREMDKLSSSNDEEDGIKIASLNHELEEIENKSRDFTQQIMNGLNDKIEKVSEESKNVDDDSISLNQQYLAMIQLHRKAKSITDDIKEYKHELIKEIKQKRIDTKGDSK